MHFRLPGAPAGRGRPGEGRRRYPPLLGVSSARLRARGLGLSRKPDASGGTYSSRVNMIAPEISDFSGRIPNSSPICKVSIYDRYSNILEGAYSGK